MAFSGAGFFYICTSADAANAGAIHMHVATHADVACDMQIDDDNGKMMSAIMRMVSGEFYAGYIHMHQMPDMRGIWGGAFIS